MNLILNQLQKNNKIIMDAIAKQDTLGNVQVDSINNIQSELKKVWENVFNQPINMEDDFFQLGGDSIMAMGLISKINRRFGVLLQIEEIIENGSFAYQLSRIQNDQVSNVVNIKPAPPQEKGYPITSTQKIFYTNSLLNKESIDGNLAFVAKVYGGVNVAFYKKSIEEIIRRHEILRTSFHIEGVNVVQKIHDKMDFEITTIEQGDKSMRQVLEEIIAPFDLAESPLFRIFVINPDSDTAFLIFDFHHTIMDLISLNRMLQELVLLNKGEPLEPLKIQYKDFAYWQQKQLPEVNREFKSFWMDKFETVPPKTNLPVEATPINKDRFNADSYIFQFHDNEIADLKELCKEEKVSQFIFLMSLFYVFLSKISNQKDLCVGLSSHGRKYPELHKLIGLMTNRLPVRMDVDPNLTFSEFVNHFKLEISKYLANQDFPYDLLVQNLRAENKIKNEGLFNVMFEYHVMDWADDSLNLINRVVLVPKGDMSFRVAEKQEGARRGLGFFIEYNTSMFSEESIRVIAKYFSSLADEVMKSVDVKISDMGNFEDFKEIPNQEVTKYHKLDDLFA